MNRDKLAEILVAFECDEPAMSISACIDKILALEMEKCKGELIYTKNIFYKGKCGQLIFRPVKDK